MILYLNSSNSCFCFEDSESFEGKMFEMNQEYEKLYNNDEDGMSLQQFEQYDNINDFIKNFEDAEAEKNAKILLKKNQKI